MQASIWAFDAGMEDTTAAKSDSVFQMSKSPWGAVLRSAILPGWGQIYNGSYLKAPIIWGIAAALIYGWIQDNNDYKFYRDLYVTVPNNLYKTRRDFYRDRRDMFTIYLGLTYFLNLVDAYVDAHLFDFTVEENFLTKDPMLNLKINLR
jgi:hypothetical protein